MPVSDEWGILDSWPSPPADIPGNPAPLMVAPMSLMDADGGSREAEASAFPANRDRWEMWVQDPDDDPPVKAPPSPTSVEPPPKLPVKPPASSLLSGKKKKICGTVEAVN